MIFYIYRYDFLAEVEMGKAPPLEYLVKNIDKTKYMRHEGER